MGLGAFKRLLLLGVLVTGCVFCYAGPADANTTALTRDDVLSIRDGRFYLDGKPFAEISFNKFDSRQPGLDGFFQTHRKTAHDRRTRTSSRREKQQEDLG